MDFGEDWLSGRVLILIPLILSLSVHEWAHAWSAWLLGDDTAQRLGRLTLNPIPHIDPIGTLLLPLAGVPFGWAKPVPVEPLRFRRTVSMRMGIVITAAAGPISNLVLVGLTALVLLALVHVRPDLVATGAPGFRLIWILLFMNIVLAVFNLLPIPPLDGSRIVDGLIPERLRPGWDAFASYAPIALVAVILLPVLTGFPLFSWIGTVVAAIFRWTGANG